MLCAFNSLGCFVDRKFMSAQQNVSACHLVRRTPVFLELTLMATRYLSAPAANESQALDTSRLQDQLHKQFSRY